MKKTILLRMVRKEVRRAMKPTGLLGKRGPAKNVNLLIKREIDAMTPPPILIPCRGDCGQDLAELLRFLKKVGGTV